MNEADALRVYSLMLKSRLVEDAVMDLWNQGKILGEIRATGLRPIFTPRLEVSGYKLRGEIFGG